MRNVRWVYVTEVGEEIDHATKPDNRPTLRVETVSRNSGSVVERTYTFNRLDGSRVAPPGIGWVFKDTEGVSSVWLRVRELPLPRHEPEVIAFRRRKRT